MAKEITFSDDMNSESTIYPAPSPSIVKDLGIEQIEELPEIEPRDQIEVSLETRREGTREKIAGFFVLGLFVVIIIGMVFAYFGDESKVKNLTDMILALSGVLSAPLGFIFGYYFRRSEEN